jgi:uncharacterized protein (UPF0335 family)
MISIIYDTNTLGVVYPAFAMQVLMHNLLNDTYVISSTKNLDDDDTPLNTLNQRFQSYQTDIAKVAGTVINRRRYIQGTSLWSIEQEKNLEHILLNIVRHGYDLHNINLIMKYESAKSMYNAILSGNENYDFTHIEIASDEKIASVLSEIPVIISNKYIEFTGGSLKIYTLDESFDVTLISLMSGLSDPQGDQRITQWLSLTGSQYTLGCSSMFTPQNKALLDISFKKYQMIQNVISAVPSTKSIKGDELIADLSNSYKTQFSFPTLKYDFLSKFPGILHGQILSVYNIYTEQTSLKKLIEKTANINEKKMYIDQLYGTMEHTDMKMIEAMKRKEAENKKLQSDLQQLTTHLQGSGNDVKIYSFGMVKALHQILADIQRGIQASKNMSVVVKRPPIPFTLEPDPVAYVIDLDSLSATVQLLMSQLQTAGTHLQPSGSSS